MTKLKKRASILPQLLITLVMVAGLASLVGFKVYQQSTDNRSKAAVDTGCGELVVKVSPDGNPANARTEITIDRNYGRYYLHATRKDNGQKCSTAFDVNTGGSKPQSPWIWRTGPIANAAITSNDKGIARADLGSNFPVGRYSASFRQFQSTAPWSNTTIVNVVSAENVQAATNTTVATQSPQAINGNEYFIQRPGYIYIFKNQLRTPFPNDDQATRTVPYRTMLQMEEKTMLGNLRAVPWRFTKESKDTYWNGGGTQNLRWYIADAGVAPANLPNYKNWFWGIGDSRYNFSSSPLNTLGTYKSSYLYKMTDTSWPTYALMPSSFKVPYSHNSTAGQLKGASLADLANPQLLMNCNGATDCPSHHWKLRIEFDEVDINGSQYKYKGPALRVDQYEITPRKNASGTIDYSRQPFILRESWYFVKNVGLVQLDQKSFNSYPNYECRNALRAQGGTNYVEDYNKMDCSPWSPNSDSDSDATADRMLRPSNRMILDEYYDNPKLAAKVGKIGQIAQSDTVTLSKTANDGYEVRFSPAITGWIEVRLQKTDGTFTDPQKWYWSEKGKTTISSDIMKNVPANTYNAQYRVWVPNETFPSEKRVGDTSIPWSNLTTVVVR